MRLPPVHFHQAGYLELLATLMLRLMAHPFWDKQRRTQRDDSLAE